MMMRPDLLRPHVPGGRAAGGEYAGQVDVDDPLPALVRVVFQLAFGVARAGGPHPLADEAGAGVDAGVGEHHVEPAVLLRPPRRTPGRAPRGRERPPRRRARRSPPCAGARLQRRCACSSMSSMVTRAPFAASASVKPRPRPLAPAGDDDAIALNLEQIRDFHAASPSISGQSPDAGRGGSRVTCRAVQFPAVAARSA